MDFIKNHIDFRVFWVTVVAIIVALTVAPCVMFLPQKYGYENGLLENIQMLVLFTGVFLSFKTKTKKKFFIFVALVLGILILREVNCGRTLFFPIPGAENAFYGWKEIKYGYLAHPLYGVYIASTVLYFFINKLYIDLWNIVKKIKFPIWNIILMILGMGLGLYAEHGLENMVFEEITELLFYVSLVGMIYLYSRDKSFIIE